MPDQATGLNVQQASKIPLMVEQSGHVPANSARTCSHSAGSSGRRQFAEFRAVWPTVPRLSASFLLDLRPCVTQGLDGAISATSGCTRP